MTRDIEIKYLKREFEKAEKRIKALPEKHRKYNMEEQLGFGLDDYLYGYSINAQFDFIKRSYSNIDECIKTLDTNLKRINKFVDLHEKRLKEGTKTVISAELLGEYD